MDEKKYPKKIELNPQNVKKGGQNGGTSISPNIEGVPSPGLGVTLCFFIGSYAVFAVAGCRPLLRSNFQKTFLISFICGRSDDGSGL